MNERFHAILFEIGAKALTFGFSVIVARELGVQQFGIWSVLFAIATYLILLCEFGALQNGVRDLSKSHDRYTSIVEIMNIRLVGLVSSLLLVLLLYSFDVIELEFASVIFLVPFAAYFNFEFIYRGEHKVRFASYQSFIFALAPLLLLITLGEFFQSAKHLILMRSCLWLVIGVIMFRIYRKYSFKSVFGNVRPDSIVSYFYVVLGALLARLYFNSDIFLIEYTLGTTAAGFYAAITVFYVAFVAFRQVLINVLYPSLCATFASSPYLYRKMVVSYSGRFSLAISPLILIGWLYSGHIILLVFGSDYVTVATVHVFRIYLLVFCLLSIGFLVPNTLHVQGRSKVFLVATAVSAVANIVINLIFLKNYGIILAAYSTLIAELLMVIVSGIYLLKIPEVDSIKASERAA